MMVRGPKTSHVMGGSTLMDGGGGGFLMSGGAFMYGDVGL